MGNKGSDTTTTTSTPNPVAMSSYYDALARAQKAANKPYAGWEQPFTADPNQYQLQGAEGISGYADYAQPYFDTATGYATEGGENITAEDIARHQDPYTQQVVDATMAQFAEDNARQQSQVVGNAAAQGALGGNRVGVAQALTAEGQTRSQAPVIAGLYSKGFEGARTAAEAEKARKMQTAGMFGNLGVAGQRAGIEGGQAQFGVGEALRNIDQSDINARMQEHFRQQGYDFQTAQWLAAITGSMGSLMGGTSETQGPQPNPWTQAAGLGLTALSFINTGGRVNKASGGEVSGVMAVPGYVPTNLQLTMGKGAPEPPKPAERAKPDAKGMAQGLASLGKMAKNAWNAPGEPTDLTAPEQGPSADIGPISTGLDYMGFAAGGGLDDVGPQQQSSQPIMQATAPANNDYSFMPHTAGLGTIPQFAGELGPPQQVSPMPQMGGPVPISKPPMQVGQPMTQPVAGGPPPISMPPMQMSGRGSWPSKMGMNSGINFNPTASSMPPVVLSRQRQQPWWQRGARSGLGFAPGGGVDGEEVAMDLPVSVGLSGNAFEDRFSPVYDVAPDYKKPETMELRRGLIDRGYNAPERNEPVTAPEYPPEFFRLDREKPKALAYAPADSDVGVGRGDLPALTTDEARLRGVGTIARPAGTIAVAPQRRAVPGVAGEGRSNGLLGGLFNLSDEARQGLISTGLAMMANRRGGKGSFLAALGEGGQEGMTTYADAMAKTVAARLQAQKQAQELRKEAFEREKFERPYREMTAAEKARQGREPWQIGPDGKMIPTPGGPHDPATIRSEAEARRLATVMDDQDAIDLAKRYVVSGNRMLLSGLGFGDIGSQNRAKVNRFIREERERRGMSEEQLANLEAEWEGRKSAARTLGTTEARMGTAAFEAKGAINLAREAINNVPRTSFLSLNKLIEGFKNQTLDPNQRELAIRTQGIINAYSAVMARGANVVTDSARHKAESLISSADDPASYNRALDTLMSEIDMAIAAPEKMREHFRKTYGDKSIKLGEDAAPKAEPKAASQEVPKGSIPGTKGGKKVWKTPDGQFIPRE